MTDISLSTMWSQKYTDMNEFVRDVFDYGFTHVELNASLTAKTLKALLTIEALKISSIHSPCPNGPSSEGTKASSLSLSSLNEDERKEAVAFTKNTIELASELAVRVVVLHSGWAELNPDLEMNLRNMYEQGIQNSSDFENAKCTLVNARGFMVCPHIDAAKESLLELAGHARSNGVQLALENRVHYYEIPNIDEMLDILSEFQPEVVGYWHDVGHAEIQARTGFTPHDEWLMALKDRMIGVHLHDVQGIRDHQAPGLGDLDWNLIAENLPKGVIKVCEIGEWNDPKDTRQVVSFLQSKGIL
ncbi:MAG: sugar phosphate isomerase/epimerase [Chloroflexi bacterium]|nr:sugar phosphate isomerase/epimerase [Chloroflexota bacterium]